MKKSILFLIVILLSACASTPQVTVTPTPPPTETPIPTPTITPQFAALQEKIASSGSRFSLNEDGLVYDGAEPIPGLQVSPDGTVTLLVGGAEVILDSSKMVFSDEYGFSYPDYVQNAGVWVALPEGMSFVDGAYTITLADGTTVTLEAAQVIIKDGKVTLSSDSSYTQNPDGSFVSKVVQTLMTEWQDKLGSGYEVRVDGSVWDTTSGLQILGVDWKEGTLMYAIEGNRDLVVPLSADDLILRKDSEGHLVAVSFKYKGLMWDGNEMVRKLTHGVELHDMLEAQAVLTNKDLVDISKNTAEDAKVLHDHFIGPNKNKTFPIVKLSGFENVSINRYYWFENIIPVANVDGSYDVVDTCAFLVFELSSEPVSFVAYFGKDGSPEIMAIDEGDLATIDGRRAVGHPPLRWSRYYINHGYNLP